MIYQPVTSVVVRTSVPSRTTRFPASQRSASAATAVLFFVVHGYVSGLPVGPNPLLGLTLRNGARVLIDISAAVAQQQTGRVFVGRAVTVIGTVDRQKLLHVTSIQDIDELDTMSAPASWPPDGLIRIPAGPTHPKAVPVRPFGRASVK